MDMPNQMSFQSIQSLALLPRKYLLDLSTASLICDSKFLAESLFRPYKHHAHVSKDLQLGNLNM